MTIYKDQLEAVYKLIEKPESWTQKAYARDAAGKLISSSYDGEAYPGDEDAPLRDEAACWCVFGAAIRCRIPYWQGIEAALGVHDLARWNDTHTHAQVLALLKSAIERAPVRP